MKSLIRKGAAVFFCLSVFLSVSGQNFKRICVVGSSTAYGSFPGTTIPRDSAWTFKIKNYYKALHIIDTLYNIAVPSSDCYNGMPSSFVPPPDRRLPDNDHNITKAVNFIPKPDVIIINFPSNSYDFISIDEAIFCLKTMRDSALAKGIECYITTTQPRDGFSPSERQKLKDLRDKILTTFGIWAIDFYTDIVTEPSLKIDPLYSLGDGIHLNPSGHNVLAGKVYDKNMFFGVVPVTFSALSAKYKDRRVVVNWQASSVNNDRFIIEKSNDGIHFNNIKTINANNNSLELKNYTFTDLQPFSGKNYYRIKTESTNNAFKYSDIAFVKCDDLQIKVLLYPAISSDHISISLNVPLKTEAVISIIDAYGRIVFTEKRQIGNGNINNINIRSFTQGRYICLVQYSGIKESIPFIKAG
ncbi:MAG: SGNH/GDSL hydrolase family protein [Ferruginibacter sp.]